MIESNKIKEKAMKLFKCFIQFLEIYGLETFGSSAEVNWFLAYEFCNSYKLFDFNDELENILAIDDIKNPEEFRDAVYSYVEKQVLNGYPVWRLFNMSDWLFKQCEKELEEQEWEKDKKYFYSTKCYRCKHYLEEMRYFQNHPLKGPSFVEIEPGNKDTFPKNHEGISHKRICLVREKLIDEEIELINKKKKYNVYNITDSRDRDTASIKLKYNKFRSSGDCWGRGNEYKLIPMELKRCNYFEEDKNMTPEKFVEKYFEIVRVEKEKEEE